MFTKNSYVGFTATPFANVFINYSDEDEMLKDDLFPRDFIYALKAPSNYLGPEKYFKDKNINVQCINLTETEKTSFPLNHKKNRFGKTLFDSCYESIRTFLIANVIRDIRDVDIDTHRSMLINMSKFKDVQFTIKEIVEEYVSSIKRAIKQTHKLELTTAMRNPFVKSLKETFDVQFFDLQQENNQITRENVFKKIYKSISKIKIIVVNSSKNSSKLNYEDTKEGLRVIAVGGLALSRGLTLEGLMTSYFYRNTSTFDVLLQMGRWFGYRHGYDDLCRIWVTEAAEQNYRYIYESIKLLRQDIKTMGEEKRKPVDFGIRVRNDSIELGITAPNKMRNTESIRIIKTFYGGIFETPYILKDLDLNEQNIVNALSFLNEIDSSNRDHLITQHPYFRDISFSNVIKLLKSLHISERGQTYFDKKRILDFMEQNENDLKLFDVLIIGGKQKINGEKNPNRFIFPKHNIDIPLVGRKFDIRDDDVRMSRGRLRLGGRTDTQYGLNEEEMPITNTKAQDFLIEGRNPLLIIYFIRPSLPKDLDEEDFVSDKDTKEDFVDMFKFHRELSKRKFKYLVGFSIGFPRKKGVSFESNRFTVNKSVNYYEKDHYETNESEEE